MTCERDRLLWTTDDGSVLFHVHERACFISLCYQKYYNVLLDFILDRINEFVDKTVRRVDRMSWECGLMYVVHVMESTMSTAGWCLST